MSNTPLWPVRRTPVLSRGEPLHVRVPVAAGSQVEISLSPESVDPAALKVSIRPEPGMPLAVSGKRLHPDEGRRSVSVVNSGADSWVDVEVQLPKSGPPSSQVEFRAYTQKP